MYNAPQPSPEDRSVHPSDNTAFSQAASPSVFDMNALKDETPAVFAAAVLRETTKEIFGVRAIDVKRLSEDVVEATNRCLLGQLSDASNNWKTDLRFKVEILAACMLDEGVYRLVAAIIEDTEATTVPTYCIPRVSGEVVGFEDPILSSHIFCGYIVHCENIPSESDDENLYHAEHAVLLHQNIYKNENERFASGDLGGLLGEELSLVSAQKSTLLSTFSSLKVQQGTKESSLNYLVKTDSNDYFYIEREIDVGIGRVSMAIWFNSEQRELLDHIFEGDAASDELLPLIDAISINQEEWGARIVEEKALEEIQNCFLERAIAVIKEAFPYAASMADENFYINAAWNGETGDGASGSSYLRLYVTVKDYDGACLVPQISSNDIDPFSECGIILEIKTDRSNVDWINLSDDRLQNNLDAVVFAIAHSEVRIKQEFEALVSDNPKNSSLYQPLVNSLSNYLDTYQGQSPEISKVTIDNPGNALSELSEDDGVMLMLCITKSHGEFLVEILLEENGWCLMAGEEFRVEKHFPNSAWIKCKNQVPFMPES